MFKPRKYNYNINIVLNEYRRSHVSAIPEERRGEGLALQYPSEGQLTIAKGRDFYVIGQITESIPEGAEMVVTVTSLETGEELRRVSTNIKNNVSGLYLDFPGIEISGDKEYFRQNSCMPDLVYDPADPMSYQYTWNKCYYTDKVFTCLIFGGKYKKDILTTDQNGRELTELPEGDYELSVCIGKCWLKQRITIGTLPNKILARFHPMDHRRKMIEEAERMGYTMFLDPFPGYWDTQMFNPEWGVDCIADNTAKWKYNDGLEYVSGKIHFYAYDTKADSTSYAVELGVLQEQKDIENPERLEIHYYNISEPEILNSDLSGHFWRFVDAPMRQRYGSIAPIVFTRMDVLPEHIKDGEEDCTKFGDVISQYDFDHLELPDNSSRCVRLIGVCRPLQVDELVRNPDSTYQYDSKIHKAVYRSEVNGTNIQHVVKGNFGLTRVLNTGEVERSEVECAHVLSFGKNLVDLNQEITIFCSLYDKNMNQIGPEYYVGKIRITE